MTTFPSIERSVWEEIERILPSVSKPARYIGGEEGSAEIDYAAKAGALRWLMIYPDTYEIGLPNQGLQILYEILNERPDALAERAYAPWVDMEEAMRKAGIPLFSVENHRPAETFDILAFNLSAELVYTNLLNLIDLAGMPVRAEDRAPGSPLVIAGGHCVYNPEPLADFVDAFVMGDGEEVVGEMTAALAPLCGAWRRAGTPEGAVREAVLETLGGIEGIYVPALYEATYTEAGRLEATRPRRRSRRTEAVRPAPQVEKRTIATLGEWPYPKTPLIPLTEVVHDRLNVEVFRGCTRGCRFCQAGMITRPVRERPKAQVEEMVRDGLKRSGYDEVALTSLSTADFSGIESTVRGIIDDPANGGRVSVSLPSLRVDAFTVGTAAAIGEVRRTGLTFAPEGGTWRMRRVINKLIREEDLYGAVESAFSNGWRRVKLYFMIGLPTETDEDVLGIVELGKRCVELGRDHTKGASVTASVGGFVPKPHTPFQWYGQDTVEELERKVRLLRDAARQVKGLTIRWHDPKASAAEGIGSRGDRRMGRVIERVWREGGTFQEWSEYFDLEKWKGALAAEGTSLTEVVYRDRGADEALPWDHISAGLHRDFLWDDWQEALGGGAVEDCRWTPCYDCGACTSGALEHVVASPTPPAGGSQGTGQALEEGGAVPVRFLATARR